MPIQGYVLVIHDQEIPGATIYHSEESVSFLLVNPQAPHTILLRVKSQTVETIVSDEVSPAADGSMTIVSDGAFSPQGEFQVGPEGIAFTVEGVEMRLRGSS